MSDGSVFDTEFMRRLGKDIYGPREGGAILILDAKNARKGVGKTACAVALGRVLADRFDYELSEKDMVLSGQKYLQRLREHPGRDQPSVVVWDEAVGAGSGDSRRAMAEENRVIGQAWQMQRTKRIVHLVTLPDWGDLDPRLAKLADYRLNCLDEPIGYFRAYFIGTDFQDGSVRTLGLGSDDGAEKIAFPDVTREPADPMYSALTEKKQQLLTAGSFDADDVLTEDTATDGGEVDPNEAAEQAAWRQQVKTAIRAVEPWNEDSGASLREASRLIDYSYNWVGERVKEWERGEHRSLVDAPGAE